MTSRGNDERKPIGVIVADKNPFVLAGIRQKFAADERFALIATATDGELFVEAVSRFPCDVGIIGWIMPYCDGRTVLKKMKDRTDGPKIVVYTGCIDPNVPREVMSLGGAGFCAKSERPEVLLQIIASVAAGRMVFPFLDVKRLDEDPLQNLTKRERELLAALAKGSSNAELAKQLDISVNTVKFHLRNLYDKLSVRNRAQAVALQVAMRNREY